MGRRLVRRLSDANQPARVLVRPDNHWSPSRDEITRVDGMLEQPDTYRDHLSEVRTVIHLASKNIDADGSGFNHVNVRGTRFLAQACRDAGVRHVIYLSSVGVYGHRRLLNADEDTPLRPDTALSRSKSEAEKILTKEFEDDLTVTLLRPRFVYGPGDQHFIPGIERAVTRYAFLPVSGRARISLVHVDDLANVCLRLTNEPPSHNRAFHVNDGRGHTIKSVFDAVARKLGRSSPRFLPIPFSCTYLPLKILESLRNIDPESRQQGLTSLRLALLGQHNNFSNAALCKALADFQFQSFDDYLATN